VDVQAMAESAGRWDELKSSTTAASCGSSRRPARTSRKLSASGDQWQVGWARCTTRTKHPRVIRAHTSPALFEVRATPTPLMVPLPNNARVVSGGIEYYTHLHRPLRALPETDGQNVQPKRGMNSRPRCRVRPRTTTTSTATALSTKPGRSLVTIHPA